MTTLAHPRVRFYDQVRTAHLERAHELEPASIVYRARRYDFDATAAEGLDLVHAGVPRSAMLVLRSPLTGLEVNEPLDLASLPRTAAVIAAARLRGLLTRSRPVVVSYAIGNLDVFAAERPARRRTRVRRRVELSLARYVWRRIDRVAFGTEAARTVYTDRFGRRGPSTQTLISALPVACACEEARRQPHRLIFVGALTERKGLPELLDVWPAVRAAVPGAELVVIGTGALEDEVRRRSAADPSIRLLVDPPRPEIHLALRQARALVMLSQRRPLWREQIGLPILEALAHGCRIVTTSETGIAGWLAEHGHSVLSPDATAEERVAALTRMLTVTEDEQAREACEIVDSLPGQDGRLAADRWLFAEATA